MVVGIDFEITLANRTRLQIAKPDIVGFFNNLPNHVLHEREIAAILSEQRVFWRLAKSTKVEDFIEFLSKYASLQPLTFDFPHRREKCYVWGNVPQLEILLRIKNNLYFSHYTAVRMHGLTEQVPKTIYLTLERSSKSEDKGVELSQFDIDKAFESEPRISKNMTTFNGTRIYLLNGAHTGGAGIVEDTVDQGDGPFLARMTNIERTLIDITVRPFYAGGIFEVAKAFELAKEKISVNKLMGLLKRLDFTYPYHQAIGYYMDLAGYKEDRLMLVKKVPMTHDFYLSYGTGKKKYIKEWRLFVPEGL